MTDQSSLPTVCFYTLWQDREGATFIQFLQSFQEQEVCGRYGGSAAVPCLVFESREAIGQAFRNDMPAEQSVAVFTGSLLGRRQFRYRARCRLQDATHLPQWVDPATPYGLELNPCNCRHRTCAYQVLADFIRQSALAPRENGHYPWGLRRRSESSPPRWRAHQSRRKAREVAEGGCPGWRW